MTSVVAVSRREAWAVGSGDGGCLLVRWDGESWSQLPTPQLQAGCREVTASSRGIVWIVDVSRAVWRRDGERWSTISRRVPMGSIGAAVAAGPRDLWVAGTRGRSDGTEPHANPILVRWSGADWVSMPVPGGLAIQALSAVSEREVWAVGKGKFGAAIIRWDGTQWTSAATPQASGGEEVELQDIMAVSAGEVWVVGHAVRPFHSRAFVMRWDGRRWHTIDGPHGDMYLNSVVSDGAGGAWVGATQFDTRDERTLLHYNGTTWTHERRPIGASGTVFDMTRLPGTERVIAVGGNPSYDEDSHAWILTRD